MNQAENLFMLDTLRIRYIGGRSIDFFAVEQVLLSVPACAKCYPFVVQFPVN